MQLDQTPDIEIPFANVLGRQDILDFKAKLFLAVLAIVFSIVLFVFYLENKSLRETNASLRDSMIMYGYPNEDGVFVSSKKMPDGHIKAFVNSFINNYYNYNPDSISSNVAQASSMMCPKYKKHVDAKDKANAQSVKRNQITQDLDIDDDKDQILIEKDKKGRGYRVVVLADKIRSTSGRIYDRRRGKLEFILLRVEHSAHYQWGLTLCGIDDQMKKVSIR